MCRDTVSVGWDGRLFDCDFNQQLALGLRCGPCPILPYSATLCCGGMHKAAAGAWPAVRPGASHSITADCSTHRPGA